MDAINAMNERIVKLKTGFEEEPLDNGKGGLSGRGSEPSASEQKEAEPGAGLEPETEKSECSAKGEHKGRILFDATVCPQDIAYPTDLDLLSEAREIIERLIDCNS